MDTPLTAGIRAAVEREWAANMTGAALRLHGGEESAAFRVGDVVVRIGPAWREPAELEWCHAVSRLASEGVPEVIAPRTNRRGHTVCVVDGRPVRVWPFIEGEWVDDDDQEQRSQAPVLLAAIHRALSTGSVGPRPSRSSPSAYVAEVEDRELDAWLSDFLADRQLHQPLHGDFYAGNLLVRDRRIVAVLDWDEALVGPPKLEVAWAAWEFGNGLWADDFSGVVAFVDAYRAAGGRARLSEAELFQLVRVRLMAEVRSASAPERALDAEDEAYRVRQIDLFRRLAAHPRRGGTAP